MKNRSYLKFEKSYMWIPLCYTAETWKGETYKGWEQLLYSIIRKPSLKPHKPRKPRPRRGRGKQTDFSLHRLTKIDYLHQSLRTPANLWG